MPFEHLWSEDLRRYLCRNYKVNNKARRALTTITTGENRRKKEQYKTTLEGLNCLIKERDDERNATQRSSIRELVLGS